VRRIALYSDVHGNIVALDAVYAAIEAEGLTERYCLGDLVGLGPRPAEAVERVRASGDPVVQGNYDLAIGAHLCSPGSDFPTPQEALDGAESFGYTIAETPRPIADYLYALSREHRIEHEGARVLLCHGTPALVSGVVTAEMPPVHLLSLAHAAHADIVCCGHTHVPFHRSIPRQGGVVHWVNVGSVGRPRDGDPRAAWVELVLGTHAEVVGHAPTDTACRRIGRSDQWLGVRIHREAYEVDAVVRDMVQQGLPATLAAGLRVGLEDHEIGGGRPGKASPGGVPAVHEETISLMHHDEPVLACGHTPTACSCMFDERTGAYEALARIFRGDITEVAAAVRRLRISMRSCRVHRHIDEAAILAAFEGADLVLRTADGRVAFVSERERLYGLCAGFDPFVNVVSPSGVAYQSGDIDEYLATLEAAYREASFEMPGIGDTRCAPDHISNELAFMAHLLRAVSAGDPRALERARNFFADHLAEWAVLFAVVIGQQAQEPVMRYAGLALDKLLTCEGSLFRHAMPEHVEARLRRT